MHTGSQGLPDQGGHKLTLNSILETMSSNGSAQKSPNQTSQVARSSRIGSKVVGGGEGAPEQTATSGHCRKRLPASSEKCAITEITEITVIVPWPEFLGEVNNNRNNRNNCYCPLAWISPRNDRSLRNSGQGPITVISVISVIVHFFEKFGPWAHNSYFG